MAEIMKRKKGQILNNNERQLILNLINYLKQKHTEKSISEIIREISKATGCSERTIYKIRKEASKGITVITNRTRLRKKENKNSRNVKYDSFVKSSIRKKVHNYFLQNNSPTLNTILCLVNNDPDLPNFKRSTLHTLLKEIGFVYEQKGKKSLLTERNDLVKSRQEYLKDIRKFRSENRWIIYTGETLISLMRKEVKKNTEEEKNIEQKSENLPMTCETLFINASELMPCTTLVYTIDTTALGNAINGESVQLTEGIPTIQEFSCNTDNIPIHRIISSEGVLTGESNKPLKEPKTDVQNRKAPLERELRLTVMHAGSSQGFIQGADFITLSKKKAEDIEKYEHWFLEKLLPRVPPNSVIVTDNNAPYHTSKEENFPDGTWKKQQIKNWLLSKNVNVGEVNQKKELLALANDLRPLYSTKYKIDEFAKERGIVIISLPPFHYELNPLNTIWAQIKYYVRSNIKTFKVKKVKQLIREGFYSITQVSWMNYVRHVQEMEDLLWTVHEAQDGIEDFNSTPQGVGENESFNNL